MSASQASASAGVSFAGVPAEMRAGAKKLLALEPEHPKPDVSFDPVADATTNSHRRFGLLTMFAPRKWAVLGGLGLLVAETITMLVGPVVIQQGIDRGVVASNTATLNLIVGVYLAVVAVNVVLSAARQRHNGAIAEGLMYDLRVRLFSQYQRLSIGWYTDQKTGALLSTMTSDVEYVALLVNEGFINLIIQALVVVVVSGVLLNYDLLLAFILLVAVMPPLIALTLWFRSASTTGFAAVRDRLAGVLADLSENLAGIRVIRAMNRRLTNSRVHHVAVDGYLEANLDASRASTTYTPATEGIGIAAQGLMALIGGQMVLSGRLTPGELAAFLLFVTTLFGPIHQLVQLYAVYQQGRAGLNKIGAILAMPPGVAQKPDAVDLPPVVGEIILDDVSFTYNPTDDEEPQNEVLHNFSLHVAPGETLALVGATGAGKSTVAKLISRFYDPTSGTVTIDGHDLRDVTFKSLRSQLGVVPQEPFLFGGSIRDNIAVAVEQPSESDIEAAIDAVGLRGLLDQLPEGIDTPVHERGVSLSAGERQLLALARAFVAKPAVVVLDEATSNLDLLSESRIETALDRVTQGRTTILVAHRLATAMRADRIAVVDDGSLVELGTHDELVAAKGRYAQMVSTWDEHAGPAVPSTATPEVR